MPCERHTWFFDSPCPKCEPRVTVPEEHPGIPDFLQREKDGSFTHPGYPTDPVESAAKRKAEYALDEKREPCHDAASDPDGSAVRDL